MCIKDRAGDRVMCQLAAEESVLLFNGSTKKVEDLDLDDVLMGADGKPKNLLYVAKERTRQYKIYPKKGDAFIVGENHNLSMVMTGSSEASERRVVIAKDGFGNRYYACDTFSMKPGDYIDNTDQIKRMSKIYREPVAFRKQDVELSPYLLGLWLGDGTSRDAVITTMEPEVVAAMEAYAEENNLRVNVMHEKKDCKARRYRFTYNGKSLRGCNSFINALRHYDVLNNKHIPDEYLLNDRDTRLELLAGLVDSDGHCAFKKIEIMSVREVMTRQIVFLARSFGLAAYYSHKYVNGKLYYRINISGDTNMIPTRVPRRCCGERLQTKSVLRTAIEVEPFGYGVCYGFEVEGEDKRILLSDFTVTGG